MEARLVIVSQVRRLGVGQIWYAESELVHSIGVDGRPNLVFRKIEEPLTLWDGHFSRERIPIHYFVMNNGKLAQVPDINNLK